MLGAAGTTSSQSAVDLHMRNLLVAGSLSLFNWVLLIEVGEPVVDTIDMQRSKPTLITFMFLPGRSKLVTVFRR